MDFLANHFQETLIIGLILALFFKESLTEFINAKLGIKKEKVPEWGQKLVQYANHDTTEKLDKIDKILQGQTGIVDAVKEHNKLDERIIFLLEEQKEYGVRIRKD